MPLKIISSNVIATVQFKKANPIKWEEFQEHLKSIEITQFGEGEARTDEGARSVALAAVHKDGQIVYTPDTRQILINGTALEPTLRLFAEVLRMVTEIFGSSERMKANANFYEVQVKGEVETDAATPLEIMNHITPPGLFQPFESVMNVGPLGLFSYRFYYTPVKVDEPIRKVVPWYDLQFFPGVMNPDRFIIHIVSRDVSAETSMNTARNLDERLRQYLAEKERELSG